MFKPFIGEKCIQYANGSDGRARRHLYDQVLTHDSIKKYFLQFQEVLTWGSTFCVFAVNFVPIIDWALCHLAHNGPVLFHFLMEKNSYLAQFIITYGVELTTNV